MSETGTLSIQIHVLARRSVRRTSRQPASVFFSLFFPLLFLAVNAGGLHAVTNLPGFPTDSYLEFFLAYSFLQGATFATMNSGSDLAKDIQTGFLNRLALTPMRGTALLCGHMAGTALLGLVSALIFLSVGLAMGVTIASGFAGALVLLCLVFLITIGFAAIGAALALRTGSGEAVQGMFPLMFTLLILSSIYLPRNLIQTDWFRVVATYNPISYLIEGLRSLIVTGWDLEALALGFGFAVVILVLGLAAASAALKGRMTRT